MHLPKPAAHVILAIAALLSAAACEGFYEDVPTAMPAPPTTAAPSLLPPDFTGTPAEMVEAAARSALAARLGIDPAEPSFAGLRGATWTKANPGCYPLPEGFEGDYLVPGLRLSLVYDATRYQFDANMQVTAGALCHTTPQTPQEVSVSLADDLVRTQAASRLAGRIVTLPDAPAARAFLRDEPGIADIDVDDIDWAAEVLVGTLLRDVPSALEVAAAAGLWNMNSNVVTIEVETEPAETPSEGTAGQTLAVPLWVLVEYPPAGADFAFRVVESAPAAPPQ